MSRAKIGEQHGFLPRSFRTKRSLPAISVRPLSLKDEAITPILSWKKHASSEFMDDMHGSSEFCVVTSGKSPHGYPPRKDQIPGLPVARSFSDEQARTLVPTSETQDQEDSCTDDGHT